MLIYRSPPPPILSSYWLAHWPITQSAFGRRGERGETGITPPHAGWQRTPRVIVLVMLMPHMENGQGKNHPCFFVTFFILSKSLRKAYFLRVKLGSLERKLPRLGIDIFLNFWHLRHFRAISLWKKQGPFHPWSFWWGLIKRKCTIRKKRGHVIRMARTIISSKYYYFLLFSR